MNQKDYKEIAKRIKNLNFEKEDKEESERISKLKFKPSYIYPRKLPFDRKLFLEDCGVE